MKSVALGVGLMFCAGAGMAGECLFSVVSNAGIPGYNDEIVEGISAAECQTACSQRAWCKSVDFERGNGTCYIQPVGRNDVALDRNYAGDPYDHFTCESRTASGVLDLTGGVVTGVCEFTAVMNAGIPGFNDEVIETATAQDCMQACQARDWCKSVDYERGNGTCYIQPVGMHDEDLDRNYAGDPYDHYTCEGR